MEAAMAMRRLPVVAEPPAPRPRLVALPGGAAVATRSLDGALSGSWSALRAGTTVTCIVCGGAMAPRWTAGAAGVVGGRCRDCGTELD
jgi:hypothetical protein